MTLSDEDVGRIADAVIDRLLSRFAVTRKDLPDHLSGRWVMMHEAVEILGLHRDTIDNYVRDGVLDRARRKYRGRVLISRASIDRYLEHVGRVKS